MGTMNNMDRSTSEYAAIPLHGYIQNRTVLAKTAESITIPAGALSVLFSSTKNFVVRGSSEGAAAWPVDTDDGTGLEINPTWRRLDGSDATLSVMLEEAGEISARFFGPAK